jgi:hypothetical protein
VWSLLITMHALVLLLLILTAAAAGWVALFVTDQRRATRATGILKVALGAMLGSGGMVTFVIRLHELAG